MGKHKRIGILGGMGPESTAQFYELLTKKYFDKENDYSYPEMVIFTVDFNRILDLQKNKDMKNYLKELMFGVNALTKAGAEFIVIPSNTPHILFDKLKEKSKIPILSIVRHTANRAKQEGLKTLLLLGTKLTMQSAFYRKDFEKLGMTIITPSVKEQDIITNIINKELVRGVVTKKSKRRLLSIAKKYPADGIILGCTELPLIITSKDTKIPLLDTLAIHADATLDYALK